MAFTRVALFGLALGAVSSVLAESDEPVEITVNPTSAEARETRGTPYDLDVLTGMATSHEVGWIPNDELSVSSLDRFADLMPHIRPIGELMYPEASREINATQVVAMTLENSFDVRSAGYSVLMRQHDVQARRGEVFDTVFMASGSISDSEKPSSSTLSGGAVVNSRRYTGSVGLSQRLASGGLLDLSFSMTDSRTNNVFATLNPADTTDVSLSLTQPLLQGFGPTVTRSSITRATLEADAALEDHRGRLIDAIASSLNSHWDLYFTRQQAGVRLLSLEQARVVLGNNRIRNRVGDMTRADVLQAESAVAQREGDYFNAILNVQDAEDVLWFQIERSSENWDMGLVPSDTPALEPLLVNEEQLVAFAFHNRPDLLAAIQRHAQAELNRRVARNDLLPQLDLNASIGIEGLGGTPASSLSVLGTMDFDSWLVGLTLRYPLQNRSARHRLRISTLTLEQSQTGIDALRLRVTLDVRNAVRRIQNALDLLAAREAEVRARELDLYDEEQRFQYGLSTTDTLLDFQDDLASARTNRLAAVVEYQKSIIALEQATGILLDRWGVEITPVVANL